MNIDQTKGPSCTNYSLSKEKPAAGVSINPVISKMEVCLELKRKFKEKKVSELRTTIPQDTSLNTISEKVLKTQSGAYLHYRFPDLELEDALDAIVDYTLDAFKYKKETKEKLKENRSELKNLLRNLIINEANNPDKFVFYSGISNSLWPLCFTIKAMMKYYQVSEHSKPIRIKDPDLIADNVEELLSQWEKHLEAELPLQREKFKKKYGDQFDPTHFDSWKNPDRCLGLSFAIDSINFFRNNALCCNNNLFGNLYNCTGECSLFYFLVSFNYNNDSKEILKELFSSVSTLPPDAINELAEKILANYQQDPLSLAGGALMQIFIPKEEVDHQAYLSWPKGIPMRVDNNTGKLAVREITDSMTTQPLRKRDYKGMAPRITITDDEKEYPLACLSKVLESSITCPETLGKVFTAVNPTILKREVGRLSKTPYVQATREEQEFYQFDALQSRVVLNSKNPPEITLHTLKKVEDSRFKPKVEEIVRAFIGDSTEKKAFKESFRARQFPISRIIKLAETAQTGGKIETTRTPRIINPITSSRNLKQIFALLEEHSKAIVDGSPEKKVLMDINGLASNTIYSSLIQEWVDNLENLPKEELAIYCFNQFNSVKNYLVDAKKELNLRLVVQSELELRGLDLNDGTQQRSLNELTELRKKIAKLKAQKRFFRPLFHASRDTISTLRPNLAVF